MQLRKFLLTLLGAALAIASAEFAIRQAEPHLPALSEWPTVETEVKSSQYANLDPRPTLLIVGSSMTESAIDPQRLVAMGAAPAAYNSAFPFFSPAATDLWLRDFLKPWDDLELIIIGLPVWPPPDEISSDPLVKGLLEVIGPKVITNPLDEIALWRLRGILVDLDEAARRERTVAHGLWTELGHQTVYYGGAGRTVAGNYPPYGTPKMSAVQERALRRLIATVQQAGITPVVLLEPGRYPDPVDDQTVAAYTDWLRALTDELEVEFWDSHTIDWDESFYADETHFNRAGTIAFSQYIGERILELNSR